jgi:hypothetical protein
VVDCVEVVVEGNPIFLANIAQHNHFLRNEQEAITSSITSSPGVGNHLPSVGVFDTRAGEHWKNVYIIS